MPESALFEIPESATRHSGRRHILMPHMGFACGRVMLDDDCRNDPWVMGVPSWCWVTCAECLALGRREVARRGHLMQAPTGHTCDDSCWWMAVPA